MATNQVNTSSMVGLIPQDLSTEIIKNIAEGSTMLKVAEIVEMKEPTKTFPVELTSPGAYVVGEGQKITVDKATWATVELAAKKLGVIVPVTKEALNDGIVNVIEEVKGQIAEAFAKKLDKVTLFDSTDFYGAGKSIFELATAKGNKITNTGHIFNDAANAMGLIEGIDLDPNAFVAPKTLKAVIRNDIGSDKHYVVEDKVNGVPAKMHGESIVYAQGFDKTKAKLITGDFSKVYVGILDDIEYAISTEGTVGDINLFEQDMVAVRATMRVGFLVIKPEAFAYVDNTAVVTP